MNNLGLLKHIGKLSSRKPMVRCHITWGQNAALPHKATFRHSWALHAFTFVGLFHKIILKITFITELT